MLEFDPAAELDRAIASAKDSSGKVVWIMVGILACVGLLMARSK